MSNKRFDFSVLPDGFLIDIAQYPNTPTWKANRGLSSFYLMDEDVREHYVDLVYRPALNHWHFNDGSMVLPDGLVVDVKWNPYVGIGLKTYQLYVSHNGDRLISFVENFRSAYFGDAVIAVKIIGAHPDYAEHAKELDMPVVEL